jgi:hypothetical protein
MVHGFVSGVAMALELGIALALRENTCIFEGS